MSARVEKGALSGVVVNVFKTMAGIEMLSGDAAPDFLPIAAMVGLTGGESRMAVILRMGEGLALKAARAMLGDESMVWGPSAEDAVGELANVVAGNLKPHLQAGLALSLPTVVHGSDFAIRAPRLSVSQSEVFECQGEALVVVLAREE